MTGELSYGNFVFKHCLLGGFAIPAFLLLKQEYNILFLAKHAGTGVRSLHLVGHLGLASTRMDAP